MKLTKENVYINLQGKSKRELTDLYDFLKINNEPIFRAKEGFLKYDDYYLAFFGEWQQMFRIDNEVEVTIEQLKEILQPKDLTLEQQLQKAEAEVERIKKQIKKDNKINIGDWVKFNNNSNKGIDKVINIDSSSNYKYSTQFCLYKQSEVKKITNPEIINLLENLYNE